ncbi:MAG: hypothetical protein GY941_26130 [Planctomycetes bacterium]|nr:hypothetical protein [Planctomycetota bacterium]
MKRKLENVWIALRFGMLFFRLQKWLGRIGIQINPYYWVEEGVGNYSPPRLIDNSEDYSFAFFGREEMKFLDQLPQYSEDMLLSRLKNGKICFGVKYRGQVASFMWIDFDSCIYFRNKLLLNSHEAYLFEMVTLESFRGKNIAPNLRYQAYKELKAIGRNTFYSVSELFNSPSIRFKEKLKARVRWLAVDITVFNKYHWHKILKRFKYCDDI